MIFKPTMANKIIEIKRILRTSIGSSKIIIPRIEVPAIPIPAHTAYAVPMGISFVAKDNK